MNGWTLLFGTHLDSVCAEIAHEECGLGCNSYPKSHPHQMHNSCWLPCTTRSHVATFRGGKTTVKTTEKATCMSHPNRTLCSQILAQATETPTTNEVLTADKDTTAPVEDVNVARAQCQTGAAHVLEVRPVLGGTMPQRRHRCTRSRGH